MNNVAAQSDLDIIEKYIKGIDTTQADNISSSPSIKIIPHNTGYTFL